MRFEISFSGHENIRSLHQKTIEVTKERDLTLRGDCIIGVNASCGCDDIPLKLKEKLRDPNTYLTFTIKVHDLEFSLHGYGHPNLTLTDSADIVIRKSDFTCPRTLAVKCTKASDSIPRSMVKLLQNPQTTGRLILETADRV